MSRNVWRPFTAMAHTLRDIFEPFKIQPRAGRKKFIFIFLTYLFILLASSVLFTDTSLASHQLFSLPIIMLTGINLVFIQIRRLHDLNKTGWWQLIAMIPLVGLGLFFYLLCARGTPGENNFGSAPAQLTAIQNYVFIFITVLFIAFTGYGGHAGWFNTH